MTAMLTIPTDLPHSAPAAAAGAEASYLWFSLGEACFSVPLAFVERVVPLMSLQTIPGGPAHLAGLLNYHGESVCVVDLAIWLGTAGCQRYHVDTPMLICRSGQTAVAFIVNEVIGVKQHVGDATHLHDQLQHGHLPFVATINDAEGVALLVDIERVLQCNFLSAERQHYA